MYQKKRVETNERGNWHKKTVHLDKTVCKKYDVFDFCVWGFKM